MKTAVCEMLGIDFPLFAFSHCRDVVAAVSKAGGFGVLGAVGFSPEQLAIELDWIDAHIDGAPYGVDIVVPENMGARDQAGATMGMLLAAAPEAHRDFINRLLAEHDVAISADDRAAWADEPVGLMPDVGERMMDVVFDHPVRFIVHALGVPPTSLVRRARAAGIPVGALVGSKEHALRQVAEGVDIIIAQGNEAGGHCGEVASMVLVPEVVAAMETLARPVPVLAAGGIVSGRQMAAAMAMGASGVWTGSVWLTTPESELTDVVRDKLVAARSRDTVRSRASTGKMCRQLRSSWTEAWDQPDGPVPLPMPYQPILTKAAMDPALKSAAVGNDKARQFVTQLVGQGVGMLDGVRSARTVVRDFMEDFAEAAARMQTLAEG